MAARADALAGLRPRQSPCSAVGDSSPAARRRPARLGGPHRAAGRQPNTLKRPLPLGDTLSPNPPCKQGRLQAEGAALHFGPDTWGMCRYLSGHLGDVAQSVRIAVARKLGPASPPAALPAGDRRFAAEIRTDNATSPKCQRVGKPSSGRGRLASGADTVRGVAPSAWLERYRP